MARRVIRRHGPFPLHVLFFAAAPVLGLWAANVDEGVSWRDVLGPLGVVVLAGWNLVRVRTAAALALACLLMALLIIPIAIVQNRILKGTPGHDYFQIAGSSAHVGTYTQMAATNLLRRRPPDRKPATLFPGFGLPMLAILGACHGLRRRRLRRWTIYGIFSIGFCGLLSFGPLLDHVRFGALLGAPYHLLAAYYPGFRFARNLWRFGAVAQVFLATLAGLGLAVCFSGPRRPMYVADLL